MLVNVKPVPVIINATLSYVICSGDSILITLLSSLPNSTFAWIASSTSPTLSGYSSGSGSFIAQKLINLGSAFDTVTYAAAATKDTCTSDTVRFVVIVKPVFDATADPTTQVICSNSSFVISLTSGNPTTIFTWTATGSSPDVTGYSNGSGNQISQTLINDGSVSSVVTYKVVPNGLGCVGDTAVSTVTVKAFPDLSNNPKNKSICSITGTAVTLTSSLPGTLFTWTATSGSPGITGYSDNSVPTVTLNQVLSNSAFITGSAIYHITPQNSGCNGLVTDFTVNVFPVADILFVPPSQQMCSGFSMQHCIEFGCHGSSVYLDCTRQLTGYIRVFTGFRIPHPANITKCCTCLRNSNLCCFILCQWLPRQDRQCESHSKAQTICGGLLLH